MIADPQLRALTLDHVISAVGAAADAEHCTAHVLHAVGNTVAFCVAPHDDVAGWSGDLSVQLSGGELVATLEHSGPVVRAYFADLAELTTWLRGELAE